MTDKAVAIETIANLPENSSMEEIAEELQIMAAIRKGKEDVKAGRTKSHAEVEKIFETWISK
jgi:predicted transcriptional regulator